jgi:hypothetical protein
MASVVHVHLARGAQAPKKKDKDVSPDAERHSTQRHILSEEKADAAEATKQARRRPRKARQRPRRRMQARLCSPPHKGGSAKTGSTFPWCQVDHAPPKKKEKDASPGAEHNSRLRDVVLEEKRRRGRSHEAGAEQTTEDATDADTETAIALVLTTA